MGSSGKAYATTSAAGAPKTLDGGFARVRVNDFAFDRTNLTIPLGTRVVWSFGDTTNHDVTVAAGPVGFGSPWSKNGARWGRTFDVPGTYLLQCSLHAAYMSQVIHVTTQEGEEAGEGAHVERAPPSDDGILW